MLDLLALSALLTALSPAAHAVDSDRAGVSVGMGTGVTSFDQMPMSPEEGSLLEGAQLLAPFSGPPFDEVSHSGFHIRSQTVFNHIRVSHGYRMPITSFSMADTQVDLGDGRTAFTRGLTVHQLNLAIGAELPIEELPVVPYFDIVGVQQWARADLALPEGMVRYRGRSFAFHARGGLVMELGDPLYLNLEAQRSVVGQPGWDVTLMITLAGS